ncbi:MAG: hypothetical protein HUU15_07150 [Candidatus Brocadiae bacterium]|nr:hypothetical protein [Candidatus Brocadiia bacterium]
MEKHVEAWDALKPVFFGESEPTTPAAIWCSPDGTEIGRLTGNFTSRQLRLRLADEESWRETLALVEAIEKHRKSGGTGIDPRTGR